jgi:AbrB family looped-hinge helix DNA binding protein
MQLARRVRTIPRQVNSGINQLIALVGPSRELRQDCLAMKTKLSTKGQVVLPAQIRRKLGLRPGDAMDTQVVDGRIVLTPRRNRIRKVSIVVDPVTGLPVLSARSEAPPLNSKQVREILSEFP